MIKLGREIFEIIELTDTPFRVKTFVNMIRWQTKCSTNYALTVASWVFEP